MRMDRKTFKSFCICVGIVLGACGGAAAADDVGELQALLRDDPLTGPGTATLGQTASAVEQPPFLLPERMWKFDDCSPDRAELFNSGATALETAFRSFGVTCAPGVLGSAVALAAPEDIVYVPDEPYFTFEGGVTVAGWFRPTGIDHTQTLFRKRDRGTSAFALVLHRGRFRFVINLGDGSAASVSAPELARVGVFQHVAATTTVPHSGFTSTGSRLRSTAWPARSYPVAGRCSSAMTAPSAGSTGRSTRLCSCCARFPAPPWDS
jgi:hypothetical protein